MEKDKGECAENSVNRAAVSDRTLDLLFQSGYDRGR